MKKKDIQALPGKSEKELKDLIEQAQFELVKLKTDLGAGKIKNVHLVSGKNRDIARLKTILREKEINESA